MTSTATEALPQRTVAQKMGMRAGARVLLVDAPEQAWEAIRAPEVELARCRDDGLPAGGAYDHIQLFVLTARVLDERFPVLRDRLALGGSLWVSWPKGRGLGTDLTLPEVIRIGYDHGLVESTALAVDATWSGLKFTRPKPGTVYRNSYGRLPGCA